ncbi:MAG: restriction endonuclease subunit S [Xanthomonadales bacterium]|nr:restriction endonuclease subunit S [Xanthomonadales bacterium]
MAGEWKEVRLGELGEVNRGRSRHRPRNAPHLYGGEYPFIQTGDIKASNGLITAHSQTYSEAGLAQSRIWPESTMVITIAANIAETAILTYPACFPDSVVGFIADERKADVRFIEYLFRHLRRQIQHENVGTGSVQDNINLQTLDRLALRVPELPEQRAIAHILGTLDDKIELNRRRNQTLEAMARALFKDWFVDFGPVRAKMDGQEPYLLADLWQLLPDRLDDEGKPEGWEIQPLDQIAALVTNSIAPGKTPKAVFEHYSIPAFDVGRMPAMEVGESIKSNKYIVDPDSVLVSKLNPQTQRVWLPAVATDRAICSTEFMQFVPHDRDNRSYLYCLMSSGTMQEVVLQHVTGSTGSRQRAQPSQIAKVNILTPSPSVVTAFNRQAGPILKAVGENQRESQTLAQLRDTLLPKLISGELRIKDTEKFMESVA